MATLLLDDFSSRLAERLPCELPFEWLLIAPEHWFGTFATLRQQLAADNPRMLSVIRNDIQSKSQFLSRWQPALRFIFDQACTTLRSAKPGCGVLPEKPGDAHRLLAVVPV